MPAAAVPDGRGRLPDVEALPPMSPAERMARGRAARTRVPLDRFGRWTPRPDRPDPISMLEWQATKRDPALVPIRHARMAASAFAFFRGSAAIMAGDLASTPITGLRAQLCGDAHLVNFGLFDTPERVHVFDINDFDETLPGPWEWDLARLAASIEIAGRDLGFAGGDRRAAVVSAVGEYRSQMSAFGEMGNLDVYYARLDSTALLGRLSDDAGRTARGIRHDVARGMRHGRLDAFARLVERDAGDLRFVSRPPLVVPVEELLDHEARRRYVGVMREFLGQYRASLSAERQQLLDGYRYVEMARKVVGVGSVGTRCWVVLMIGRDADDPLLLQLKEAKRSVLEPYAGAYPSREKGRRVVDGQRLMQSASDPLLGWYRLRALDGKLHDFYVRQLWDGKASIDVAHLDEQGLARYAATCGWTLARAHARTGPRISIAAYLEDGDEFDDAMARFASTYADLNEEDHSRLVAAIDAGRVPAADTAV